MRQGICALPPTFRMHATSRLLIFGWRDSRLFGPKYEHLLMQRIKSQNKIGLQAKMQSLHKKMIGICRQFDVLRPRTPGIARAKARTKLLVTH
jgi:hypothetical protein